MEAYLKIAKIIKLGDIVIQKLEIHKAPKFINQHKAPISIENINKKVSVGKKDLKYFIGYNGDKKN